MCETCINRARQCPKCLEAGIDVYSTKIDLDVSGGESDDYDYSDTEDEPIYEVIEIRDRDYLVLTAPERNSGPLNDEGCDAAKENEVKKNDNSVVEGKQDTEHIYQTID